ncbi:hypothetical protein Tco_1415633 [Tanacetum coccineum]
MMNFEVCLNEVGVLAIYRVQELGDQVKLERWQGMVRARVVRSEKDGLLGVQGEEVAFFLVPKVDDKVLKVVVRSCCLSDENCGLLQDSPKDKFRMGASHTLEATHVEFFRDEDEPEVVLGKILNSYTVPTTPNTRIYKDHPIKNVIGDVKSYVQTRRMTKPTFEQGFLSDVYEQKTHNTMKTYLYACFLSQIKPTSIAKALSDSSWVEAM